MTGSDLRENQGYLGTVGGEKEGEKLQPSQDFEKKPLIYDGSERAYVLYHYLWLQWEKLDPFRKNASVLVRVYLNFACSNY